MLGDEADVRPAYVVIAGLLLLAFGTLVFASVSYWRAARSGTKPTPRTTELPIHVGGVIVMVLLIVIVLVW